MKVEQDGKVYFEEEVIFYSDSKDSKKNND